MALLLGATVHSGCLIGMKATLLSHSVIVAGAVVAAAAVVLERQIVPTRSLMVGISAKIRRELSCEQSEDFIAHARRYSVTAQTQATDESRLSLQQVRYR